MAEVINLRVARKQAERTKAQRRAQQNRLAHGRTKAERALDKVRAQRSDRQLDAHRLKPGDSK